VGAALVAIALLVVAQTPVDTHTPMLTFRAQLFEMAGYTVLSGLILFVFAAYHRLTWERRHLGIALGLGIAWCELMAAWGVGVNRVLGDRSFLLGFVGMATYHVCVLLWFYYLLSPAHPSIVPDIGTPIEGRINAPIPVRGKGLSQRGFSRVSEVNLESFVTNYEQTTGFSYLTAGG
jgi:hypothetical protein